MLKNCLLLAGSILGLAICATDTTAATDIGTDSPSRMSSAQSYPEPGTTYLTYRDGIGYQVNYIAPNGEAWLWYPGIAEGIAEEWRLGRSGSMDMICWRHPQGSDTELGRDFQCNSLKLARSGIVARLPGDPYKLSTGQVPYTREACSAPKEFRFDRSGHGC
ncbi:hypothetical protein [Chachezhania sediminis]|uniref:hypothetical protein n=1 Tax=Chachezhania sediminis TaxID=2599291 RepID=UPI00131D7191|nr:hypothetical protein [Chachezhania sediminis]